MKATSEDGAEAGAPAAARLTLNTTEDICRYLDQLMATGLFGRTRASVAERLLAEKLREVLAAGLPGKDTGGSTKG